MAPRFAWCWTCCGDDPSSRERARLPVSESVRYAAQFRWPPHARAGPPAVGCLRRPSLFIRLPPQGPAKNMYWDTDGFAIWAKRLETGVYRIPSGEPGARRIEITTEELAALLSGIDLSAATRCKRYRRAQTEA